MSQNLPDHDLVSHYDVWKKSVCNQTSQSNSYHQSLGRSVRMRISVISASKKKSEFRLSFKSDFHDFKNAASFMHDEDEEDSATSQSEKHMRKFFIDDTIPSFMLKNEELFQELR